MVFDMHSDELFSRQETQQLLDRVSKEMPKLVEDFIPGTLSLSLFHKVLQNLLAERVAIRDIRTIIDTLAEQAAVHSDADALTAQVRIRLGRAITHQWFGSQRDIEVTGLDPQLEGLLMQAVQNGSALEPGIAEKIIEQTGDALREQSARGAAPVLLVNPALRLMLSRFLRRVYPQLAVLSNVEIAPDRTLHMIATIGGAQ